ncbi:MAG: hypothetical protein JRJ79_13700 [Deltaproteobacteria bacterium]|nr:hypothetical protein [Deltaproteobacteria bacterium]
MRTIMNKTKKPIIGGVLTIFSGLLGLLGIASYAIGFGDAGSGIGKGDMPPFVPSIIFGMSIPAVIIALLAIAGGILAVLRKRWRWSLAGSIAAALSLIILGIPAIVLVAISKDEFE